MLCYNELKEILKKIYKKREKCQLLHSTLRKSETLMWEYQMPSGGLQRQYADSIVQNLPVLESVFAEIHHVSSEQLEKFLFTYQA